MDIISPEQRSALMSRIRGADTGIELKVRKGLHALGFRYRLGGAGLPGRPDIVLPKYRAVVFVHGCFWHGHDCVLFRWPKSRPRFWKTKIITNQGRDQRVETQLLTSGWMVLKVWECELRGRTPEQIADRIASLGEEISKGSLDDQARNS